MTFLRGIQVTRPDNWWLPKIPPLLAVGYLSMLATKADFIRAAFLLGCYLFSLSSAAAYGHVVNDSFDVDADLRAGKGNAMAGASWARRLSLCAALLLAGFAPAWVAPYTTTTLLLLALTFLWPTLYSVPGLRLKERGVAGLACDALGSHVTPTLVMLSLFGMTDPPWSGRLFPWAVVAWSTALGLKGILHHQMKDRAGDIRSATVTFATATARPERLTRFLTCFNLCVVLPISAALALATVRWAPAVAIAFAAYCLLETAKYLLGFEFALTAEAWTLRRSVPFTNESFYTVWAPLAAVIQSTIGEPTRLWMPVVHVLLFYPTLAAQWSEMKAIARVAGWPQRSRQRVR